MKKFFLMALCVWVTNACQATNPEKPGDFYGTWNVTKINAYSTITDSEKAMNALLGTQLILGPDNVLVPGQPACKPSAPMSVNTVLAKDEVPPKAAPSATAAGLPAKVEKLYTSCLSVYMVDTHLVFFSRGAWYTAERAPAH